MLSSENKKSLKDSSKGQKYGELNAFKVLQLVRDKLMVKENIMRCIYGIDMSAVEKRANSDDQSQSLT